MFGYRCTDYNYCSSTGSELLHFQGINFEPKVNRKKFRFEEDIHLSSGSVINRNQILNLIFIAAAVDVVH